MSRSSSRGRSRRRTAPQRHSLAFILSLATLVLGLGFIGLAVINIAAQSAEQAASAEEPATVVRAPSGPRRAVPAGTRRVGLYDPYPSKGDKIGSLRIPAIDKKLPIYQGTSDRELKRGVGHFLQSVLPGEADNCVLSGHRDTVFTELGGLKKGDRLITRTSAGTFTYEIRRIRIVDKDDKTVIVPTDHAVLTVSTCYPFSYVGRAPKRFVLVADLVGPAASILGARSERTHQYLW